MFRRFLMKPFLVSSEVEHLIDPSMAISFRTHRIPAHCYLLTTQAYHYIIISAYLEPGITTLGNSWANIGMGSMVPRGRGLWAMIHGPQPPSPRDHDNCTYKSPPFFISYSLIDRLRQHLI